MIEPRSVRRIAVAIALAAAAGCAPAPAGQSPSPALGQGASARLDAMVVDAARPRPASAGRFPDLGFERVRADAERARNVIGRLDAIPDGELGHQEQLTKALLRWDAGRTVDDTLLYWYRFEALPAMSPFRTVMPVLAAAPVATEADRTSYLSLLREVPAVFDGLRTKMAAQLQRGIAIPAEQVDPVLGYLRTFAVTDRSPFLVPAAKLGTVSGAERSAFEAEVARVVAESIVPAARATIDFLDGPVRRAAPANVGMSQYPGGKEAYRVQVRRETTLDITPEAIHQLALRSMDELEARMQRIRDSLGFKGTRAEFHEQLRRDPRFYVATADAVGRKFMEYAERLEPVLDQAFSKRPRAPYGVRRLELALEPSMTYGYYNWPIGTDPHGYYNYNGSELETRSLLMAGAIAFHELIPGHHFQINLQRENSSLPPFRRNLLAAGYTEGWGEYTSSIVASELGMYRDPWEIYGRLVFDAFFIARLVVDTGMNFYGWPRSRAVAYMTDHTLESAGQIESETIRYSIRQPAQALAYRMGRETFVGLREKAERELGAKFDRRRFHDALLDSGALPLFLLERHIGWWLEQQR